MSAFIGIVVGVLVVALVTAVTGYFVAQEFGYTAVDRSALRVRAKAGDPAAERALRITSRTSFLLSGAQLGITVTGLLAGYVAEPLIGDGIAILLGGVSVPDGIGAPIGAAIALLFVSAIQMIFGELFPKNLAIARPESLARRLAWSTALYLRVFGPVVRLFDHAATLLVKLLGITPAQDVRHAATAGDLHRIVDESSDSGALSPDVSRSLERGLDFVDATAEHAMVPRPRVVSIGGAETVEQALTIMASGHSRLPVRGEGIDDITGLVELRELLDVEADGDVRSAVRDHQRSIVRVPASLRLPAVLDRLRESGDELACVVDEYGGLAGVVTLEDIAEELVGEIADTAADNTEPRAIDADTWLVSGSYAVDELERLIDREIPPGDYESVSGLVLSALGRLPRVGDEAAVVLPSPMGEENESPTAALVLRVESLSRRVPRWVRLKVRTPVEADNGAPATATTVQNGLTR